MIRHVFIFLGTFVVGALVALAVRAAAFKPHAGHAAHPASGGDYAPMVSNTPPAADHTAHATHAPAPAPTAPTGAQATVNSVCAICGMAVDPKLPTLQYKGQTIGFGCKLCAPKFQADPDRYGPLYLKNETVKR